MDDTLFFLKSGQNLQNFGMNLTHMFFFPILVLDFAESR